MAPFTLTHCPSLQRLMSLPREAGELVMQKITWDLVRQLAVAAALSAVAVEAVHQHKGAPTAVPDPHTKARNDAVPDFCLALLG